MRSDHILVATDEKYAQIRVFGKGAFACSQNLRDFCSKIIETKIEKIIVDLSECTSIDSTFMGVLAMVGLQGRKTNVGVEIVNVDEAKKKLLKGLGLEKLFTYSHTDTDQVSWELLCNATSDSQEMGKVERAKTMLEAHETLIEVDSNNKPKFKDVIEYLKEDVKRLNK